MIGPSRRRSTPKRTRQDSAETLHLHRRLARSRGLHRRLFRGSAAALVVSLVLWGLGVSFPLHLGGVVAGFALGLLLPVKGSVAWALGWIETHTGLAYRTALELPEGHDPYGYHQAVRERASEGMKWLEPPSFQPWWLPLLALALGLALLPAAGLPGFGFTPPTQSGSGGSPPPPPAAAADEADAPEAAEGEDQTDTVEAVEPDDPGSRAEAEPAESLDSGDDTAGTGAEGEAPADGETLSRFLEGLRERDPAPPPGGESTASPAPEGTRAAGDERLGDTPPPSQSQAAQRPGEEQRGNLEESEGEGEGEGAEGAQAQEEPSESEGDEGAQAQTEGEEGETDTQEAQTGEEGEESLEETAGEGDEGEASARGEQGEPGEGTGNALSEGEEGEGAGSSSSAPTPSTGLEEGAPGTPELLRGRLGDGPTTRGPEVLLPGSDTDALPTGSAPEDYERAVERAITEGRIPVEYQEILRNYFR